ncbi:MAG: hypothetical protein B1H12_03165 [Desulfobacteraceae bacterium 4484_190.2]|nr:MAG: hypothetical protein B1H12_03165 [Desulfobacteraceae bacterium 4484_190.2]
MKRSKTLIAQALSTLKENMERTGDPLGFRHTYWTEWANGLGLPKGGKTVLLTARMYQMLPYVIQTTDMVASIKPLLAIKGFGKVLSMGNRLAGETVIRLKAIGAKKIKARGTKALKGIISALNSVGEYPAYLYEAEPYSGVLLYDLGLEDGIALHINKVYELLKDHGVEEVIAVDPHTTFMMKEIYPKYIKNYDIRVKHYLEVLSEGKENLGNTSHKDLPKEFVMHDSCVMTRDLGIVECPICLINLMKYEAELGVRVWDMGEILHAALVNPSSK